MTQKLTINYGIRLDVINPQTINEPGTPASWIWTRARSPRSDLAIRTFPGTWRTV